VDKFFAKLAQRAAEVKQRCRWGLQAQADELAVAANQLCAETPHGDLTVRLV
jgi:hypothetical protein